MFDIKWIRENAEAFDEGLRRRGLAPQADALIALDEERRAHIARLQEAQTRRNAASKEIGQAMATKDSGRAEKLKAEVAGLKEFIQAGEATTRDLDEKLRRALEVIPNLPLAEVPEGTDESGNVEYRRHGALPNFPFPPKEHFDIGEGLGQMDFAAAAKLAGSRFTVLTRDLARLERALGQFMLDLHVTEHGYTEVSPPLLVNDQTMFGTGQLPKFEEDLFHAGDRWLVPTAEVPLTNLAAGEILDPARFPLRFTALTPCFRSEAGSAGKDTRGMLRQHQFWKVELVSITDRDSSLAEHERMLACAEEVLKRLGLHYRVMTLCTGDMGFSAQKTYDIEVWLPGQGRYREISSCSICGDFQARRMNARYRLSDGKGLAHVHTLNGSGVAVGRALIAVLENYQNEDGSVTVPDALVAYMGGQTRIAKAG
ncbi:MAG: serine--tRNA ligase [Alphaproteobacteria bacterium]|nr:MAG: serine--tRNA ligase [Alphaproteobacteria bacterium]